MDLIYDSILDRMRESEDLSVYAEKSNVLELDNATAFTPDADYEPATKKYVDDGIAGIDLSAYLPLSGGVLTGDLDTSSGDYGYKIDGSYVLKMYGTENFLLGKEAGLLMYTNLGSAQRNVAVGRSSLRGGVGASFCVAIGEASQFGNTDGTHDLSGGYRSLFSIGGGDRNTTWGSQTGFALVDENGNSIMGYFAGRDAVCSNAVLVGNSAGRYNTADDVLYIANTPTTTPLIWGNFISPKVIIHGELEIKPDLTNAMFEVVDDAVGFFGTAPVAQQTGMTDELTTITHTAPTTPDYAIQDLTNSGGFGFATQDEGNTVLSVIANLQARTNELETVLKNYGLLA